MSVPNSQLYDAASVWDQAMQPGQQHLLRAILDFWPQGVSSVLDVGCGDGKISRAIAQHTGAAFTGADISKEALERLPFPGIEASADALPFEAAAFTLAMSTDSFEHLPDAVHEGAWRELFRVAAQWVMVAVPWREELLDAMARCGDCGQEYHVNWHQRSYDIADLAQRAPEGWEVAGVVLSGEAWSAQLPQETYVQRRMLDCPSGWDMAVCPHCGAAGEAAPEPACMPDALAVALGEQVYAALAHQRVLRSHSEVLAIYRRCGVLAHLPALPEAHVEAHAASALIGGVAQPNLVSYPQVAQRVATADGGELLQFPLYEDAPVLTLVRAPGASGPIHVTLVDGAGELFSGLALHADQQQAQLTFSRNLLPGRYGVVLYSEATDAIAQARLGEGPVVQMLSRAGAAVAYHAVTGEAFAIYVQVRADALWFDEATLPQAMPVVYPSPAALLEKALPLRATDPAIEAPDLRPRVLMLCHDQHLDRRVAAQAHSLLAQGCAVTLFMLAHGVDDSEETDLKGLHIRRVGLGRIVPENSIYRAYMKRQYGLNFCLNQLAKWLRILLPLGKLGYKVGARANYYYYRGRLYSRYRSRVIHDPLPFRSAFFGAAKDVPCDVVQVHDLPALEAGVQLAALHDVPLVYDAHELYPEQAAFSRIQRRLCSEAEAQLIGKAQRVFAVNDSIGEEMAKRYGIAVPITLLNALNPDAGFDIARRYDLLREKLGLAAQRRILLFQGGFSPNRNLETLVAAMAHVTCDDVDLVMLGFGAFGEKLKAQAEASGLLGRRIYFLDAVPQNALLQHSASADIGIIPYPHVDMNSYFCTPNKLFEFIQAGLPMLANQSPELERFVAGNGFGHTAPMGSVQDIARAIDAAFAHADYGHWRSNLLAKRDQFNWDVQETRYLQAMAPYLVRRDEGKA